MTPLIDGEPAFERICQAVADARRSVWVTVPFLHREFVLPRGMGSFLSLLDRAAGRGLDARVIFGRPSPDIEPFVHDTFGGTVFDHALLRQGGMRFSARWDGAPGFGVQHQKSWVVDAGTPTELAFIGGINLKPEAVGRPGHAAGGMSHDVYAEIAGPAAADVHANFVQRWNGATERLRADGRWGDRSADELAAPTGAAPERGEAQVQIQRTIPAGMYGIAGGERSILEQYLAAIDAAGQTIYIENQSLVAPSVLARLRAAAGRGVEITMVVPGTPERAVRHARRSPAYDGMFADLAALGDADGFSLSGLAVEGRPVRVHSKVMVVDDEWATIGSCNLRENSLATQTEMNASVWDPAMAAALRRDLLAEHEPLRFRLDPAAYGR